MDIAQFKTTFDGILQKYVNEKIQEAKKLINDKKINTFIDYISTFIFSGGKRIRPYGLWLIYTGFGGTNEKAIFHFGIIFELLHSMALIHDDIIDQADKRHNAPTMHSFIQTLLAKHPHAKHISEGQALLIGDLLLSRVYELRFKHHDFSEKALFEARKNVHHMIEEVILGQMIDVDMMISEPASLELIDKKNMYKTASYTFVRPMLTGAILADASPEQQQLIIELGKHLGLAFQVKDDLADLTFGDPTKSAFTDIQEGQQTYFTNYIFTHGTSEQKQFLTSCMGKKLTDHQISALQTIFETSGAIAFGRNMIKQFNEKSRSILEHLDLNDEAKYGLLALIKKME